MGVLVGMVERIWKRQGRQNKITMGAAVLSPTFPAYQLPSGIIGRFIGFPLVGKIRIVLVYFLFLRPPVYTLGNEDSLVPLVFNF